MTLLLLLLLLFLSVDDDYVYDVYLSHQCNMETVTSLYVNNSIL